MKRGLTHSALAAVIASVLFMGIASATCTLTPELINQDPYPAVPGDYVTLIFQLKGVENSECGTVSFELLENYPISFDPNVSAKTTVTAGTFVKDYVSYLRIPYKVRIDHDAIDGDNKIEVRYSASGNRDVSLIKSFNVTIKDVKSDFEIFVKNYDPGSGKITFEILNTGKNDVEALTMMIGQSGNLVVRGPLTNIVGSLDSNDFTTADFDVLAEEGDITLTISYTDPINERRTAIKTVYFDPKPFLNKADAEGKRSPYFYAVSGIIVLLIAYFFYRRHRNRKERMHHHQHQR
jgi:hypothetical protein